MNAKFFMALAVLVASLPPLLSAGNPAQAAVPPAATRSATQPVPRGNPSTLPAREIAWLGVSPGNVPDALFTQLGQILPPGQGVLVEDVIPDSPAARAGIRVNDILVAYDDQKLFSARQLIGLVRTDRPDRDVAVQVIQQGQLKTLHVTLGKRDSSAALPGRHPHRGQMPMRHGQMPMWPPFAPWYGNAGQAPGWDQFESVEVHSLPDGRYHAEVSYKDEDNNSKQFSFEGTREEIRAQIGNTANLPEDKKQALLQALNLNPAVPFGRPMFGGNPFNDPFFQGNPFDDDFFRGFPPLRLPPGFPSYFQPSAPADGAAQGGGVS